MGFRRQLPVASPIPLKGLIRSALSLAGGASQSHAQVRDALVHQFGAQAVALTDSGTSALVLALRLAAGPGGIVAFPAYVCVDLIAAARRAGVYVRLYDVDPHTLSPDLQSVRHALSEGVTAIVVVHLYGFPADVPGVRAIADEYGVVVVEDAAQHAGATLHERAAGTMGDLSILSFGRGKGTTAGNGGALLAFNGRCQDAVEKLNTSLPSPPRGAKDVLGTAASWALGRPSVYALPASLPMLHLGETVYHEAHEPEAMSIAGATLLLGNLSEFQKHVEIRQRNAAELARAAADSARLQACIPIDGGIAGYLRFPIVSKNQIDAVPRLGIVRGYPRPLLEYEELQPCLLPSNEMFWGARELARGLLTLPTHHMLSANDVKQLSTWLRMA